MLRPYQIDAFQNVRLAFRRGRRAVCLQLPTGAGKTVVFSEMVRSAVEGGRTVWIVVPRNELLLQASDELAIVGVNHGRIAPGFKESLAFSTHVVSSSTLIRRWESIKRPPDFMIIDEAHLYFDRQKEIWERFPETKIVGVTATPERLDGRGLSELYGELVTGPTIQRLIELGYLSGIRYFAPPLEGLKQVHRRGTEFNPDELDALLTQRKVYGKAIDHYRRHADRKPALVYCRSIKAAAETAGRFSDAGYRFENIDGGMSYKKRKTLIDGLRDGDLDGLTSCELVTYGLDVPRVEAVIMLRPTLSKALFYQMIGRGLRTWQGKKECVVLDHVGNLQEHGHPLSFYDWKFRGREKTRPRKTPDAASLRLCPELDFLYCEKKSCIGCEHNKSGRRRRPEELVDTNLVPVQSPVKFNSRPSEEQREILERIESAITEFRETPASETAPGAVGKLLEVAKELGRDPMWVYWRLSEDRETVNVTLLHEIARQAGYKPGWAWYRRQLVEKDLEKKRKRRRTG